MRASEFLIEDSSEAIQNALENWMEMESSPRDIQTILSSPKSAPYKKPPNIKWLYRAIVPKDKDINSIKSTGQVVAFATDIQGAINFIRTLEIQDDWVIIRKPFNPSDFLLDFTSMYEAVAQGAQSERYIKEHEVWMKPTSEYTTAKKNEIVYSSKEDDNGLTEYKVDNKNGLGSVPYNQDVDYFGMKVMMKPSTFLQLALPLNKPISVDHIAKHLKDGGSLGAPFLDVSIPPEWEEGDISSPAKVTGHEGRNRMLAIQQVEGDDPVEVHIFPKGGMRARDLTPEIVNGLRNGMMNQEKTRFIRGDLFK